MAEENPYEYHRENPFIRIDSTGMFVPGHELWRIDQLIVVGKAAAQSHLDGTATNVPLFPSNGVATGFLKHLIEWEKEWKEKR